MEIIIHAVILFVFFIFPAAMFGVIIYFVVTNTQKAVANQHKSMKDFAAKNGLKYTASMENLPTKYSLYLLPNIYEKLVEDVIEGKKGDLTFHTFDYCFKSSPRRNSRTNVVTVCLISGLNLKLTNFVLREKNLLYDYLNSIFKTYQEQERIKFDEDPKFSETFTLFSAYKVLVKESFNNELRRFFLEQHIKGYNYECEGDTIALVVYRQLTAEERMTLLDFGTLIAERLEKIGV